MVKEQIISFFQKNTVIIAAFIIAFFIYSGFINVFAKNYMFSLLDKKNISEITGYIASNPIKTGNGKYYSCKFKLISASGYINKNHQLIKSDASGFVTVLIPSTNIEAHYPGKLFSLYDDSNLKKGILIEQGACCKLNVRFSKEDKVKHTIPRFYVSKVYYKGFDNNLWGRISYFRGLCRLAFKRLLFAWGDAGGLLLALLSGSSEYTNSNISKAFKDAGLAHVLALSGMHLSFFSNFACKISIIFGKKIEGILSFFVILLFVWFAGFTPSLFRAFISYMIMLVCRWIGVKINMLRVLALTFILHICIEPEDSIQISFLLSYGALFGILTFGKICEIFFSRFHFLSIGKNLSASIGAQITSAPICISFFGKVIPGGILSSLIISPLVTFFLTCGVISIIISFIFPFFIEPIGFILKLIYNIIAFFVQYFSFIPALEFK